MKKNEVCPLCKSKEYFIVDRIEVSKIVNEYHSKAKVNHFFWNLKEIKRLECINCWLMFFDYIIEWDSDYYSKISWWYKYYSIKKWDFDIALETIKQYKPDSILEIWCGNWYFLEKLPNVIKTIAGNELNKSAIEECEKKWIKIIDLDNKDEHWKYDMIVTFQVFEHINDAHKMIQKSYDLLRNWWIFLLAVPSPHWYLWKVRDFLNLPPHHALWWTKSSFEYLKKYNLEMIDYIEENISYWSFLHYIFHIQDLPQSAFWKIISKIQKYRLYFRWPTIFDERKFNIKWHSHIWVFKKDKT